MLEGFTKVSMVTGLPSISVTKNGLTFNKPAIVKLGKPTHVNLLQNEEQKKLAIQVCDERDNDAISFLKDAEKSILSVRWNNSDLLKTISQWMNWDLDKDGYRVEGDYYKEENAMIFDLNQAKKL